MKRGVGHIGARRRRGRHEPFASRRVSYSYNAMEPEGCLRRYISMQTPEDETIVLGRRLSRLGGGSPLAAIRNVESAALPRRNDKKSEEGSLSSLNLAGYAE